MRIVLEEVFKETDEGLVKLGEIVIYSEQLSEAQRLICKNNWPKKYTDALKEAGFEV